VPMKKKKMKDIIKSGKTMIGGYAQTASPEIVEIVGHIGFDYIILSSEDTAYDVRDRAEQIYAADAVGLPTMCRPPTNDPIFIRRALDMGMDGLNVPLVNTAEEARRVVRAAKYPPVGERGLNAMSRPTRYGADFNPKFFESANEDMLITINIETKEAVDNVEEIVEVEGIDVFYVGPTDLSISLGVPGDVTHPLVQGAGKKIREAARKRKKAVAHVIYNPFDRTEIDARMNEGYEMLSVFLDVGIFRRAVTQLHDEVRKAVDELSRK
jgi:4-hydroxy-2-oxoheptanedioate aldolase